MGAPHIVNISTANYTTYVGTQVNMTFV